VNKFTAFLGAAVLGLATTSAHAGYTLEFLQVDAINPTLTGGGWTGYTVKLVGDGGSDIQSYTSTIDGFLHQAWYGEDRSSVAQTVTRATIPTAVNSIRDSFFFDNATGTTASSKVMFLPTQTYENNNRLNGIGSYDRSPLTDIEDTDRGEFYGFGVGSFMTASGTYTGLAPTEALMAFIIIPDGGYWVDTLDGLDDDYVLWNSIQIEVVGSNFVRQSVSYYYIASSIPEPASLSLLGLGVVGLLARRRR